jgi:DNA polymerase-3 subunit alpha
VCESYVNFGVVFYDPETKEKPKDKKQDAYVRFGLGAIKNVGIQPAEAIVKERKEGGPFKDFPDFLRRNCAHLNKKAIENLAMAGALDSLCERQKVLENIETILRFTQALSKNRNTNQIGLFGEELVEDTYDIYLRECEPAEQKLRLQWERELLGIYLSDHPISSYLAYLPADREHISDLQAIPNNDIVKVAGIVMTVRKILTKSNQNMAFVALEDETGQLEVIVFPRTWAEKEKIIIPGEALVIEGKVSRKDRRRSREDAASSEAEETIEEVKILMETCARVSINPNAGHKKNPTRVTIRVPESGDRDLLQKIKSCIEKSPGKIPVTLLLPTADGEQALPISHKVEPGERLFSQLGYLLGSEQVIFD